MSFGHYEMLFSSICRSSDPAPLESFVMGMAARSISGVSMLPFTVVKTRFECGKYDYRGVRNALITIYRAEGARGKLDNIDSDDSPP